MGKGKRLGKGRYRTLEVVTQPVGKKKKKIIVIISVIFLIPNIYIASINYQRDRTLFEIISMLAFGSIVPFFVTADILDGKIDMNGGEIERSKEPFQFWFYLSIWIIVYIANIFNFVIRSW